VKRAAALGTIGAALVAAPLRAQTLPAIRVGTTPIDAGAQPYYAEAMGFFKTAGVTVEIQAMSNGAQLAAGVASGALDIAQSNVVSIAEAHDRGIPFVLLAPASTYNWKQPQSALLVGPSSPIRTAKDLSGKTIAVSGLNTISELGPQAWIDRNGGNLAAVKFVEMPFAAMSDALLSGRVDAALVSEPELSNARAAGARLVANAYDAIAKEFLIGAWFATRAWVAANPDAVRRYVAAMAQAARWANAHQSDSAKILAAETHVPIAPDAKRVVYGETLDPAQIQPLIDACAAYGLIKTRFPAADIIATTR
jgi:NitT/TauT family transport system substrate-binding protein